MNRAFTLIEVLVVIAIVALLVGILIPSLGKARTAARGVVCSSNQKQIMTAFMMYADTYADEHHASRQNYGLRFRQQQNRGDAWSLVPPYEGWRDDNPGGLHGYWGAIYDEFLGVVTTPSMYVPPPFGEGLASQPAFSGWEVFRCPDARKMDPWPADVREFDPFYVFCTYGFNGVHRNGGVGFFRPTREGVYDFDDAAPNPLHRIQFPARMIVFQDAFEHMLDANGDTLNDLFQYDGYDASGDIAFAEWEREYFRHSGGCNTAWLDGHAENIETPLHDGSLPWYSGSYE
ncbi:MAG: prepilin-type N-terminal cleavage/methylation domain-containing protein [Phycisphaerales bacterium]|nr:prepilin-type N-terminal cleavage/methylation domain-containing protein [Phycisphaerales bacterium]